MSPIPKDHFLRVGSKTLQDSGSTKRLKEMLSSGAIPKGFGLSKTSFTI